MKSLLITLLLAAWCPGAAYDLDSITFTLSGTQRDGDYTFQWVSDEDEVWSFNNGESYGFIFDNGFPGGEKFANGIISNASGELVFDGHVVNGAWQPRGVPIGQGVFGPSPLITVPEPYPLLALLLLAGLRTR